VDWKGPKRKHNLYNGGAPQTPTLIHARPDGSWKSGETAESYCHRAKRKIDMQVWKTETGSSLLSVEQSFLTSLLWHQIGVTSRNEVA
jgi:hypothetical protein